MDGNADVADSGGGHVVDNSNTPATDDNLNLSVIRTVGQLRAALDSIADERR